MTDSVSSERYRAIKRIFGEAATITDLDARHAFLDEACRDDAEVRSAVDRLLSAQDDVPDSWDETRNAASDTDAPVTLFGSSATELLADALRLAPEERLGPYRIVRAMSEGGMGTVYEAEQSKPRRLIALKIMRADLVSEEARRRFDYESQALARLRHPGIAQVYEAGVVDRRGRAIPFIAMELVPDAMSITQYARQHDLSIRRRLVLFERVCTAVQHAHANGVIHRDLKPANILVESTSDPQDPAPKIIDFGIARITDADVAAATMQTTVGQLMGTLAYMSPEQTAADPSKLDTRTDVYSLGVVLYELLAGQLPHAIQNKPIPEALQIIRDDQPTSLGTINRHYRGDLETIVGKALEKDARRRYQTANDLACDIRRFLDDEPIIARPPSAVYQLQKFAKRHTALVVSALLVAIVLVGAIAVVTPMYILAGRARDAAQLEVERQDGVIEFLKAMLKQSDPMQTGGEDVTVREMLDVASGEMDDELEERPDVRSVVESAIAASYASLGLIDKADEHYTRAVTLQREHLRDNPIRLAETLVMAAGAAQNVNDFERGIALLDEGLQILEETDPGDQAALADRIRGTAKFNRGVIFFHEWRLDEALVEFQSAYRIVANNAKPKPDMLNVIAEGIANTHAMLGHHDDARTWYYTAMEHDREANGPDSLTIAYTLGNLASLETEVGNLDEAESLIRRTNEIMSRIYGPTHQTVATGLQILGDIMALRGDADEAIRCFEDAIAMEQTRYDDHHDLAILHWRYGLALLRVDHDDDAESQINIAIDMLLRLFGREHELWRTLASDAVDACVAESALDVADAIIARQIALDEGDDPVLVELRERVDAARRDRP